MFDWFGGLKWWTELARKDKALALIVVLLLIIGGTVKITAFYVNRGQARDDAELARAVAALAECKADGRDKDKQIATLNLEKLDMLKEFNEDLKDQRERFRAIEDEKKALINEAAITNKRNTRKLNTLSKIIVNK